jgi:hypothetical protein
MCKLTNNDITTKEKNICNREGPRPPFRTAGFPSLSPALASEPVCITQAVTTLEATASNARGLTEILQRCVAERRRPPTHICNRDDEVQH